MSRSINSRWSRIINWTNAERAEGFPNVSNRDSFQTSSTSGQTSSTSGQTSSTSGQTSSTSGQTSSTSGQTSSTSAHTSSISGQTSSTSAQISSSHYDEVVVPVSTRGIGGNSRVGLHLRGRYPLPFSQTSSASGSERSESYAQMHLMKPDLQGKCQDLEQSAQKIKRGVFFLVAVCAIVVIVYIYVIVSFLIHQNQPDCVSKEKVDEFKRVWDPEDKQDIMDLLKGSGFVYDSSSGTFCFTSLQWVLDLMGKISSSVQDSVSSIEDQQKEISQTVHLYMSENKTTTDCSTENEEPIDCTDPLHAVFAHFFLDTDVAYTKSDVNLLWIREGQDLSSRHGVDVLSKGGQFIIRQAGFYFVYSHLVFKEGDPSENLHRVFRNRNGHRTKLLETFQGSASLLQGVFRLRTDDRLSVEASTQKLDMTRDKASYFGIYFIRFGK